MIRKNESGFTLVEVLVAVVVLSLLMVSVTLLMGNWVERFKTKNFESQLLIEAQTINTSLRESLKSATYYKDHGDVVEIQLTKGSRDVWYYYIVNDGVAYLLSFNDKQEDATAIAHDKGDFLANYTRGIDVVPSEYSTADDNAAHTVNYSILTSYDDVIHETESFVLLRNGH